MTSPNSSRSITIIPIGAPDCISPLSEAALRSVDRLFLQTAEHPLSKRLKESGLLENAAALDEFYRESFDFDELNARIAERLVSAACEAGVLSVGFAVLGRGAGAGLVEKLAALAKENGIALRFLPGIGFADSALAAAFESGLPYFSSYDLCTARELTSPDPETPLVIEEADTLLRAGEIKLMLSDYYGDEAAVLLASMDGECRYCVRTLPIHELDHAKNSALYGAATVLIVPPLRLVERKRHGFSALVEVLRRLRAPGGCPWDAEQTHGSLRSSLIEESYEVLDALDREDLSALEEELGDLLLQIVFHAIIEEERGEFTDRDVTSGIVNKLIYRHPHVFGSVKVTGSDEVLANWEELKKKEKHQDTVADAMASVPAAFPALMRSAKIQKKAAHVGFDWDGPLPALDKVLEEAEEVREALLSNDADAAMDELGDLLFACVNASRLARVDPELALNAATEKFIRRFVLMEQMILADGRSFAEMNLFEMDIYWNKVKKSE